MKKWWPRLKCWGWWLGLMVGAALYFSPYLQTGLPVTHDGENHVARFAQYYLAIRQGQWPPRVAPTLENGYGYPVFNFNYPLANLLSVPLALGKIDFEMIFKLLMAGFWVLGGICFYQWQRRLTTTSSPLPTLVYWLAPYLWTTIWYRGNIGEVAAYALVPLVLWQTERLRVGRPRAAGWLAVSLAAFFLAHNIMALFVSPLLLIYAGVRLGHRPTARRRAAISWLIALGASLWFWLPALAEKRLTILDTASVNTEYQAHWAQWDQLLGWQLSGGLSWPGSVDGLSVNLGLVLTLVLCLTTSLLLTQPHFFAERAWLVGGLIGVSWLGLFSQTSASQGWWAVWPLVNYIQFPWRLQLIVEFLLASSLLCWPLAKRSVRVFWIIAIAGQVLIMAHSRPTAFVHHDRDYYLHYAQSTSTRRENAPQSFTFEIFQEVSGPPQVATGSGQLLTARRLDTTRKDFTLECDDHCLVIEGTADFPGFQTRVDGQLVPYVDEATIGGRIAYWVEAGQHQIVTTFGERTLPRLLGDLVSLVSLGGLSYLFIIGF